MGIWLPNDVDTLEPNLLVPGLKPVGPVEVDSDLLEPGATVRWCVFPERKVGLPGGKFTPRWVENEDLDDVQIDTVRAESPTEFIGWNRGISALGALDGFSRVHWTSNAPHYAGRDYCVVVQYRAPVNYFETQALIAWGYGAVPSIGVWHTGYGKGNYTLCGISSADGSSYFIGAGNYPTLGKTHTIVFRVLNNNVGGSLLYTYLNGATHGNGAIPSGFWTETTWDTMTFIASGLYGSSLFGNRMDGAVFMAAWIDGKVSAEQAKRISKDPYLFLKPMGT